MTKIQSFPDIMAFARQKQVHLDVFPNIMRRASAIIMYFSSMKQAMRAEVRQRKQAHSQEVRTAMSGAVRATLLNHPQWQKAQCVMLYHPLPDEVDVAPLLDIALASGKSVLLPEVVSDDLQLRRYTGIDSLQRGAFGILEPTGEVFPHECYADVSLVIVPGMAFDAEGHRLGRGKGFYDRLLPRLAHAYCIGVCYPFQRFEKVPSESHDCLMNEVISE